jgi:hypothetical protein
VRIFRHPGENIRTAEEPDPSMGIEEDHRRFSQSSRPTGSVGSRYSRTVFRSLINAASPLAAKRRSRLREAARDGGQVPGALHHVIIRGIERREIFRDDKNRDFFLDRLGGILLESQ